MEWNDILEIPSLTQIIFSCFCAFLFSTGITWLIRLYAIQKNLLDIPNERSSHQIPTPQGGGLSIVLIFIFSVFLLGLKGMVERNIVLALVGGGITIAATGHWDDRYNLKISWRFFIQFLVAIWILFWLNGFSRLDLGLWNFTLHWQGILLGVISIIWAINLYNFMDGIDGLAGSEGFFVSLISGFALWSVHDFNLAFMMWILSAAIAGFMVWNWPPAKIFLGDVGSGFIGLVFITTALHTANRGKISICFWLILLAVFISDATFTLVWRAIQGKRWYAAHREHAYQNLTLKGISHKQITICIALINIILLFPLAFATLYWPTYTFWFLLSALLSLFCVWMTIKRVGSNI